MAGIKCMMILLLVLLCCTAVAGVSVIITTKHLGIPPMPSSRAAREQVLVFLGRYHQGKVIQELGSGWGGLTRKIAMKFPDQDVLGVEASFLPCLFSKLSAFLSGPGNLSYIRANFLKTSLSPGRSYVCYLSTALMETLQERLSEKLHPGFVIISMVFAFSGREPLDEVLVDEVFHDKIYVYRGME